jgi:hypothetical protein
VALDVNAAMDVLGAALATIPGLRVYDFPPDKVAPPAAWVELESVDYDSATRRDADEATFRVYLVVAGAVDRARRDALYTYLDGAGGDSSVKAAVDALGGSTVRVTSAAPATITVADVAYQAAAVFDVHYIA